MSKITGLLDRAKRAVAAGESSLRKAAELIAQAHAAGASQKQITERLSKSRSWVTFLLAWHKGGYQGSAAAATLDCFASRAMTGSLRPAR
jgi:site-specific recombinase XerC